MGLRDDLASPEAPGCHEALSQLMIAIQLAGLKPLKFYIKLISTTSSTSKIVVWKRSKDDINVRHAMYKCLE
jgi:hypothetical protein